jgi:hypothetical protein
MLYISAYQVIKKHILNKTEWGQKLNENRKDRQLIEVMHQRDEHEEYMYSPVHFDLTLVMQLLKETINEMTTNQKYVLIEGLCNSQKLDNVDDQLKLRFMDEFFSIEAILGEVKAILGLQFNLEQEYVREDEIEYEEFPDEPVVEEKKKPEGDEDEEEALVEEEEGGPKKDVFKKEDF